MTVPELKLKIEQASFEYYTHGRSTISDVEYDSLVVQLKTLEAGRPDPTSPTQTVGTIGGKVKHKRPMLSLDNTFTPTEIVGWFESRGIPCGNFVTIEPKVDGLSISLHYDKGHFVQAVTRGDGSSGDDVTHVIKVVSAVPKTIDCKDSCEIRGEVYMSKDHFVALNQEMEKIGDELFSTPRNAAAGLVKRKDTSGAKWLSMIAYWASSSYVATTQADLHQALTKDGFQSMMPYAANKKVDKTILDEAIKDYAMAKAAWPFDVDGLVFKLSVRQEQFELGNGTRSPNWAVAFKWPPTEKKTTLKGITVQVGRLGTLTPVAELEPVTVDGTVITRATLHNEDEIARLNIGIGDEVMVCRAAEVIPRVTRVVKKLKLDNQWLMPLTCPCCGTPVKRTSGLVAVICPNVDCEDQVFARLEHAVKKQSLDIDGCGEKAIRALMAKGVRKLSDIFAIQDFSFLGDAAGKRVAKGVDRAKDQPLWRKLHALGIDGFGSTLCKEFCIHWRSLFALAQDIESSGNTKLASVLGPVVANNVVTYVTENVEELARLQELGVIFENQVVAGPLTGKIFVITGGLVSGSRDEVSAWIENKGGTVKSSVGKAVHYLIFGEGAGATKAAAARKHGTQVITEEELYTLAGTTMPVKVGSEFEEE